eukprot:355459-Chlamydomonas_euryale.AAC.4
MNCVGPAAAAAAALPRHACVQRVHEPVCPVCGRAVADAGEAVRDHRKLARRIGWRTAPNHPEELAEPEAARPQLQTAKAGYQRLHLQWRQLPPAHTRAGTEVRERCVNGMCEGEGA